MTEAEFFEQILGIEEIQVDRVDWQEQALHIYCSSILQWFGQFWFSSWSHRLMELSENSELRAATIGQAKSTGYFMQLRI